MKKNKNKKQDGADSNETVWSRFGSQDDSSIYIHLSSEGVERRVTNKQAFDVIVGNPPHPESVATKAKKNRHFKKMLGKAYDTITEAITPEPVLAKMLQCLNRCDPDSDILFINPRFGKTTIQEFMKVRGYKRKSIAKIDGAVFDTYKKVKEL